MLLQVCSATKLRMLGKSWRECISAEALVWFLTVRWGWREKEPIKKMKYINTHTHKIVIRLVSLDSLRGKLCASNFLDSVSCLYLALWTNTLNIAICSVLVIFTPLLACFEIVWLADLTKQIQVYTKRQMQRLCRMNSPPYLFMIISPWSLREISVWNHALSLLESSALRITLYACTYVGSADTLTGSLVYQRR